MIRNIKAIINFNKIPVFNSTVIMPFLANMLFINPAP